MIVRRTRSSPDECRGSGARVHAELGVDVFEVLPNCHGWDPKALGDLSVCSALGDEIHDLALARRKPRDVLLLLEKQRAVN